jgi:CheY-like chemotaxis protein
MEKQEPEAMLQNVLRGRRVLLVENDYITAEDLKAELERLGVEVMGPAPDVASGMDLLASDAPPDAAILDINLSGEMVFPLADRLREQHIPFIFATGYDCSSLPEPYTRHPCHEKPLDMRQLVRALAK